MATARQLIAKPPLMQAFREFFGPSKMASAPTERIMRHWHSQQMIVISRSGIAMRSFVASFGYVATEIKLKRSYPSSVRVPRAQRPAVQSQDKPMSMTFRISAMLP